MENKEQEIHFSQKAILFNDDGKILTIRRTETAPSRPLHWDLPGGIFEFGEDLKEDIIREIEEETGLGVTGVSVIDAIGALDDRNEFWVTICYIAKPTSDNVVLSYEHDEFKWVSPDEFLKLKASPKNRKFVEGFRSVLAEKQNL